MKKWVKAILSGVVMVALTAAMLSRLTGLLERKDAVVKYGPFFGQEEDFDVLFFGSSHMLDAVFPMELWEDYGIVSYSFGGHSNRLGTCYWMLDNALEYTTPKLVVIDCYWLGLQELLPEKDFSHVSLDAFPLTGEKIKAITELTDDPTLRSELLWNFCLYHDRWREIGEYDFSFDLTVEKGAEYRIGVGAAAAPAEIDKSQMMEQDSASVQYLKKMIALCRDRGIQVLPVYVPCNPVENNMREANRAQAIAAEYGVNFIDFFDEDVIDYNTDTFDGEHLNPSGARKLTDYLGGYMRDNYDIPDRRDDPDYAGWYEDYKAYTAFKVSSLAMQTDVENYLMLLQDKHLSSILYLAPGGAWHGGGVCEKLLANLGIESEKLSADSPTLAVTDNGAGTVLYLAPGEETDTSFGRLAFAWGEAGYQVLLNGEEQLEPTNQIMAAAVVDRATDRVVTTAQFAAPDGSSVDKAG